MGLKRLPTALLRRDVNLGLVNGNLGGESFIGEPGMAGVAGVAGVAPGEGDCRDSLGGVTAGVRAVYERISKIW